MIGCKGLGRIIAAIYLAKLLEIMEKAGEDMDKSLMVEFVENLDGAAILNEKGEYIYVSKNWEKYTGVSAGDALGKKVWDVIPDTHAREVYKTGKPVFAREVRKRGRPAFTSYFPRIGENGQVQGIFLYIMFQGMEYANDLKRRLTALTNTVDYYKQELSKERGARYGLDNIIGKSDAVKRLKEKILHVANSSSTVLIEGETGTGKELIAHAIHGLSSRSTGNFVRVNCAAIPEDLMESEFFGYAAGAFTGASKKGKIGRFELANGGSIFLDEINLLSQTMQPKFLRALQEREIDPVGGDRSIPIDVRVIAASNLSLEKLVNEGRFRSDLYYRLNVVNIHSPALRERMEDIPLLTDYFIHRYNDQLGMVLQGISSDALNLLMSYDWPGNIRELQNAVESAMNVAEGSVLHKKDFYQLEYRIRGHRVQAGGPGNFLLKPAKQAFEKALVQDALAEAGGNRVTAARLLGISRTVLYDKMKAYDL